MAGWDGAGNFTVNYSFVQDALNGIKILASRQDTQWATVVAGLMNCQTRDGQNSPTANWNFGGFKINNLGAPAVATDAARLQDINANLSEWKSESNPFTFVSATAFQVTGVNVTSIYKPGKRLKILHNGGATLTYFYVISSSFAANTTVNISGGVDVYTTALTSPITAISYSILDPVDLSLPLPGCFVGNNISTNNLASATTYNLGKAATPFAFTTSFDTESRFSTALGQYIMNNNVLAWYQFNASVTLKQNGATVTSNGFLSLTGLNLFYNHDSRFPPFNVDGLSSVSVSGLMFGGVNPTVVAQVIAPTFTGGPVQVTDQTMSIFQVA